jgi:anion-transporting  ArsA/GET3 family ATPase
MAGADVALEERTAAAIFDGLATRRLIVVSGKGGVGRTTLAALLGVALANRGRKVLVATTGHDDRLAWMVGASELGDDAARVTERLWIQRLVPQTCIREYGGLVLHSQKISAAVFDNRIVKRLLRAIPGLDDFALVGKAWHEAIRGGEYDTVIFDGPATGHLLYVLGVPQAVLDTIPYGPLTKEARLMQDSFEDPERVQSVLVGLPEHWPLTELGELGAAMRQRIRMHVAAIVVNGLWPDAVPPLRVPSAEDDPQRIVAPVIDVVAHIGEVGRQHHADVDAWKSSDAARTCGADSLMTVPWRWEGIVDFDDLQAMLAGLDVRPQRGQAGAG